MATDWLGLARDAVDLGMLFLLITGGEPLIRSDFFEIYEPLTEIGLYLTLFTNGTLVTPEVARRLAQRPPYRLEVTLYGASAATYEKVTGSASAFQECCAGIEALRSAGVSLLVKSTLCRHNLADLPEMRRMASQWGVPYSPSWLLTQRRDGASSMVGDFRLTPEEVMQLVEQEGVDAWPSDDLSHRKTERVPAEALECGAGKSSFVIDCAGTMMACMDLPAISVRPLKTGFQAAWAELRSLADSILFSPSCGPGACRDRRYCPWCPAMSYLETGTYTDKVHYACEVARARQQLRRELR